MTDNIAIDPDIYDGNILDHAFTLREIFETLDEHPEMIYDFKIGQFDVTKSVDVLIDNCTTACYDADGFDYESYCSLLQSLIYKLMTDFNFLTQFVYADVYGSSTTSPCFDNDTKALMRRLGTYSLKRVFMLYLFKWDDEHRVEVDRIRSLITRTDYDALLKVQNLIPDTMYPTYADRLDEMLANFSGKKDI